MAYTFDETRVLSRKERSQLLRTCRERAELDLLKGRKTWPTRSMLVYLAFYSGLRVSEIASLKLGDLFTSGADPYILVRHGKGDRIRKVYIPGQLVKMMKQYIKYKNQSLGQMCSEVDPLFASPKGTHVKPLTLMKSFKVAIESAGLRPELSIHCARHTYATFLLEETSDLAHVKKQLGHKNVAMTLIYADLLPERNTELVNRLSFEE